MDRTVIDSIDRYLAPLLPDGAHHAVCAISGDPAIGTTRVRDFTAGRAAAAAALSHFGLGDIAVGTGARGAPCWPAGIVGSITHADGIAAAAVARESDVAAIGLDLERVDQVDPSIAALVLTEAERAAWPSEVDPDLWLMLHFSAKESVYKALARRVDRVIEFQEIALRIDMPTGRFTATTRTDAVPARAIAALDGRFAFAHRHVLTVAMSSVR